MSKFNKGLNRDTSGADQPKGTWSYAKNAIVKRDIGGISNERGTGTPVELPSGYQIVGTIEVNENITIIFSHCSGCGSQIHVGESEIGIFDHSTAENTATINPLTGQTAFGYRAIYHPNPALEFPGVIDAASDILYRGVEVDLDFSPQHPISGTYRFNSEGDLLIYWTDDHNPPRYMNVTKQLNNITILTGANIEKLYGIAPTLNNVFHNEMLSLSPSSGRVPVINDFKILFGGSLKTGNYTLFIGYEDDKNTQTNYVSYSMPVYITDEPLSVNSPFSADGAVDKTKSGKSITWYVSQVNPEYKYLRCLVVERHADSSVAYELERVEIQSGGSNVVTFSGDETASISSPQEAVKDHIHYSKAKSLEILESTQYMANLESTPTLNYQKYANFIKLTPVIENYPDFDLYGPLMDHNGLNNRDEIEIYDFPGNLQSYKNPKWATYKKGYMRDEIYAFYIAFIKKDGSMTPAYHIPGRAPIGTELDQYKWPANDYRGGDTQPQLVSEDLQRYEFVDYSGAASNPTGMNYWENKDEFYPNTNDYLIEDAENPGVPVGSLVGQRVRHHHFPANSDSDGLNTAWKSIHTWEDTNTSSAYYTYEVWEGEGYFEAAPSVSGGYPANFMFCAHQDADPPTMCIYHSCIYALPACDDCSGNSHSTCPWTYWRSTSIVDNNGTVLSNSDVVGATIEITDASGGNYFTSTITGTATHGIGNWKGFELANNFPSSYEQYPTWNWTGGGMFLQPQMCVYPFEWAFNSLKWKITKAIYHPAVTTTNGWRQEVNLLGFKLDDVKIPHKDALDLQGFRIYRAKRKQADKTILGQSVIIPMKLARGYLYSSYNTKVSSWCKVPCRAETFESGHAFGTNFTSYGTALSSAPPFYNIEDDVNTILGTHHGVSFHDFSMLKQQSSLVACTHFQTQYNLKFNVHYGTAHGWGSKIVTLDASGGTLDQPKYYNTSAGSFLFGLDYQHPMSGGGGPSFTWPYFITESAKAYVPSRSIYKPEGNFGADYVHNIGGETSMIFKLANPGRVRGSGVSDYLWHTTVDTSDGAPDPTASDFVSSTPMPDPINDDFGATYLEVSNLKSIKRNVYNSFDDQELEWTGYEVTGEDFQRFIVYPNGGGGYGNLYGPDPIYGTGTIFGGDTYLCRYGFRSTWDSNADAWAIDGVAEWSKSCSYRALYSIIVESTDNINYRHSTGIGTAFFPLYSAKNLLYSLEGACVNNIDYRVTTGEDIAYAPDSNDSSDDNKSDTFMGGQHYDSVYLYNFDSCNILDLTAPIGSVHPGNLTQALTIPTGAPEGIMYNLAYSHGMDMKTPIPYPKHFVDYTKFPTRVIRSLPDSGIEDSLRIFYVEEYIDLDKSKGEINHIFSLDNLLYVHAEDTLLKTKGKQKMQTSEGVADIGSGDIFAQTPEEVIQTTKGYAGSSHMATGKVTSYGYIWLDYRSRTVFRMADKLEAISDFGLSKWFQDNIPHALEEYGMNSSPEKHTDGIGFHSVVDHVYNRYIITKKEPIPTEAFTTAFEENINNAVNGSICWFPEEEVFKMYYSWNDTWDTINYDNTILFTPKNWTVSFQLDANYWVSYHDYTPELYISTRSSLFGISFNMQTISSGLTTNTSNIYEHDVMFAGMNTYTSFYSLETPHMFHFEFVANDNPSLDKGFFNFMYTVDVEVSGLWNVPALHHTGNSGNRPPRHDSGFTHFFVHNHTQMSDLIELQNLVNVRKVGGSWKVNSFRDLCSQALDSSNPAVGLTTSPLPILTVPGVWSPITNIPMLIENGMHLSPNASYLNLAMPWDQQKRFSGKYVNIHLISDNLQNNLLTLHDAVVGAKPYMR